MFAARLWWMLRWLGHDATFVLDGGFDKWQREGKPKTSSVPAPRPAMFAIRSIAPTVSAETVAKSLETHALLLIDARAPERYRGETEPLDRVAGHIPGAFNRPYTSNVNPDGTFKPPEILESELAKLVGATSKERVVHYCGSGVTACHNVLAMEIAGIRGTRLYPGSWSEWCADPARPVAVGDELK
jgi:thiosulfate/3-mercaptopyruvate sulfurtransferase